jgi:hypothetical protein
MEGRTLTPAEARPEVVTVERMREVVALHFHPEWGSVYWLRRQEALGWDVRDRVRTLEDLWLLGPTPPEELRRRPLRDFVPRGLHGQWPRFVIGETAGTSGGPCATITTDEIAARYTRPAGATFGGNLVSCRAALATLAYHREHRLGARSTSLGARLLGRLREVQARRPEIAEVRGLGLMIGVELRDADIIDNVLERLKDDGYLLGKTGPGRNVLTLMPPLVVSAEDLDGVADAIERALREMLAG